MKSLFSIIVAISAIAYGTWFFLPHFWGYLYDVETIEVLQWDGYGSKINIYGPIPYLIGILYLVSYAGLLAYKTWARNFFLLLTVFSFLSAPFWGIAIQGGYDAMVGYVVSLSDGVIITMTYLSSISNEFNKNA